MRMSWLYFAVRSERESEPVLIWPQLVATARSAMVRPRSRRCGGTSRRNSPRAAPFDGVQRLGQRADLVDLDQDRVGEPSRYPAPTAPCWSRRDRRRPAGSARRSFGQRLPALPVVLRHAVLDRDDRVARRQRSARYFTIPAASDLPSPSSSYLPSLKNSVAAQSSASATSSPGL